MANRVLTLYSNYRTTLSSNFRLANCDKILGISRRKTLMALSLRSTTRLPLSGLVVVSICLCAVAVLPLPQLAVLTWVAPAEAECPCQEDRDSSEEEIVFCSSAHRRLNRLQHRDLSRIHETGGQLHQNTSYASHLPAIVGHQLANGLCAPLLT